MHNLLHWKFQHELSCMTQKDTKKEKRFKVNATDLLLSCKLDLSYWYWCFFKILIFLSQRYSWYLVNSGASVYLAVYVLCERRCCTYMHMAINSKLVGGLRYPQCWIINKSSWADGLCNIPTPTLQPGVLSMSLIPCLELKSTKAA